MPIYPYTCKDKKCGHSGEQFARMADNEKIRCERCGGAVIRTPCLPRMERRFAGTESKSLMHGFHPDDVQEARRRYPSWDIDDRGDVTFQSRSHQKKCAKERARADAAEAAQAQEQALKRRDAATRRGPKLSKRERQAGISVVPV